MSFSVFDQTLLYCNARFGLERFAPALLLATLAALVLVVPGLSDAQAAGENPIQDTICNVVKQLNGPVGRGIAMVAVIFLGFSLFLGKVTWGLAISLAIGIAAIFGAGQIVKLLGGDNADCTAAAAA